MLTCRLTVTKLLKNEYENLGVFSAGTIEPITDDTVNFLGMKLSASDAETGLNTTFALLIVVMFGAICLFVCVFVARKQPKKKYFIETITLEKKM